VASPHHRANAGDLKTYIEESRRRIHQVMSAISEQIVASGSIVQQWRDLLAEAGKVLANR